MKDQEQQELAENLLNALDNLDQSVNEFCDSLKTDENYHRLLYPNLLTKLVVRMETLKDFDAAGDDVKSQFEWVKVIEAMAWIHGLSGIIKKLEEVK